jgi:hypothetical protein
VKRVDARIRQRQAREAWSARQEAIKVTRGVTGKFTAFQL